MRKKCIALKRGIVNLNRVDFIKYNPPILNSMNPTYTIDIWFLKRCNTLFYVEEKEMLEDFEKLKKELTE